MYLKNPNTAGYDPVGCLRKLVKRPKSRKDTQILPVFGSNRVQIGVLWACYPKGKVARGSMNLKNPNATVYDPVGGLRKSKKVDLQNRVPPPTQKPPISSERVVVQKRACARWIPEKKLEE